MAPTSKPPPVVTREALLVEIAAVAASQHRDGSNLPAAQGRLVAAIELRMRRTGAYHESSTDIQLYHIRRR